MPSIVLTGQPQWVEQGPGPITGVPTARALPDFSAVGAVETLAVAHVPVSEANPGGYIVYAGTVDGGVWRADNITDDMFKIDGNPRSINWVPLTDSQRSLAISSLALDPRDRSGQTLWVGTGTLNSLPLPSVPKDGLLRTTDGGQSWTPLGRADLGAQNIVSVVPLTLTDAGTGPGRGGQVVVVAGALGGIYYSDDGGTTFQADADPRLNNGFERVATDLIADPTSSGRVFAAIQDEGLFQGIYDAATGGFAWTEIDGGLSPMTSAGILKLAAYPGGATPILYAVTATDQFQLSGVFRSPISFDGQAAWSAVGPDSLPSFPVDLNEGHLAIAADPTNPYRVYISGFAQKTTASIYLGDAQTATWSPLAGVPWQPHPDSRHLTFLNATTLLETDDGGVYGLPNIGLGSTLFGYWVSLNANLRDTEFFSVAYDAENNTVVGGAQDNGTPRQSTPNGSSWTEIAGMDGDGGATLFDDSVGVAYFFADSAFTKINRDGDLSTPWMAKPGSQRFGSGLRFDDYVTYVNNAEAQLDNFFPIALNDYIVRPKALLFGITGVYESFDTGTHINDVTPSGIKSFVTSLAYGTQTKPFAAYVGSIAGQLFVRSTPGATFQPMTTPAWGELNWAQRIVIDPEDYRIAYLLDAQNQIWVTTDAGGTADSAIPGVTDDWHKITGGLSRIQSLALYDPNPGGIAGNGILLAGGQGVYRLLGLHDLLQQLNTKLSPQWNRYGTGLANALVTDLHYIPGKANSGHGDVLLAGTWGRGAWLVRNASETLPVPEVLEVNGDTDFPGEDDAFRLVMDGANKGILDVFVNNASARPDFTVPLAEIRGIIVAGLGASDIGGNTLILDETNGPIQISDPIFPTAPIRFEGGDGANTLQVIDTKDPSAVQVSVGPDTIRGLPGPINYVQVSTVKLMLTPGKGSVVDVQGSAPGNTWTVRDTGEGGISLQNVGIRETFIVEGLGATDALNLDGNGNDTINVQSLPPSPAVVSVNLARASTVNVTPFDRKRVPPDSAQNLDYIRGDLRVNDPTTSGTLVLDDLANADTSAWTLTGNAVSRSYVPNAGPPVSRTIRYSGIIDLALESGGTGNTYGLDPVGQALDELPPTVRIADKGRGALTVYNQQNTDVSGMAWTIAGRVLQRYVAGGLTILLNTITYANLAALELDTGGGPNDITLSPRAHDLDELPVNVQAPGINQTGIVTIHGGGQDTLTLDDQNNRFSSSWTVTSGNVARTYTRRTVGTLHETVTASINYSGLARLVLNGGNGMDRFHIQSLPPNQARLAVQGGVGTSTLQGPDTDNAWVISGSNSGRLDQTVSFANVQTLVGGSGVDVFRLLAAGKVSHIDGGGAPAGKGNWLDYSSFTTPVAVNLATGAATNVGGGFGPAVTNIQDVHGGNGGNRLTGNSQGNILVGGTGADTIQGGTGRSLLIGDQGADQITGGSGGLPAGGDILIGGTTVYDALTAANEIALMALLAEWQSADSYAARFRKINTGLPGGYRLTYGTTVNDDGAANNLTAASSGPSTPALDWFFAGALDTLVNLEPGEHRNNR
jgi:hypothetical protein